MAISLPLLALTLPATIWALPAPQPENADSLVKRDPLSVPFYGTSANGFTAPPRGWNSFGMDILGTGWPQDQDHVQQQCDNLNVGAGFTLCSIDSGWSGNGGDPLGRLVPDTSVFPDLKGLADHLHSQGMELGVYILPGALSADAGVTVEGTNIKLGSLFDTTQPSYNLRQTFDFTKDGVQQWHNSVVNNFAEIGVDMIKMDFLTPGSPAAGEDLPANNSLAAVFYHRAIQQASRPMRLDLSWKLERDNADFQIWRTNSDSIRTDQDINNDHTGTFVSFEVVQRAIENYRIFINQQVEDPTRQNIPIMVRPDMDNMYVGNAASITGVTDQQRYTIAIHWIGAGANLITGSDLTQVDSLGQELLYNSEALSVADFTANFPMQPKNPFGTTQPGSQASSQLQAWIAGPDDNNENAVVVLANYGPDLGQGSFGTQLQGTQLVNISLSLLGIANGQPNGAPGWNVRRVWGGGGQGGSDHADLGVTSTFLASNLGPGESVLYKLTRAN
ncbi:glycoside hydrolase family 27 protein [Xylogone sp. PMI_703]|nr:glycoside hydrolase family 27 protein [Xylogone sp. PMI_703]